ncbi:MAG: type II toxin-antitoxin system PemK/MazF family toxin [Deltaproteobacteria bacterium]|nr:MAG: type II toxin-antitoxin system PemK/MazF family toxin [Deltaproteobacteria bacterium]TMA69586.1 MAG: type II toxin-antitoxin system PemK/MazF family toxin [Deltaproteobacteria bacterium]TMB44934.1 MAG: type II toxin-antitoxin system PemK/MazF family toxin [Deltaproteobacteria bacterium]
MVLQRVGRRAGRGVRSVVKPGEVALVRFPFTDITTTKKRPALVLARTTRSPRNRLVTLAMITSQVEALRLEGDVLLANWKAAGLLHPSLLRLAKVATVDEQLIDKTIGRFSARDLEAAREAFRRVFAAWVR